MKKFFIRLGNMIAIFAMFTPLYLIYNYSSYSDTDFIFWFICSILYDIYMYNIFIREQQFEKDKEHYYTWIKTYKERSNRLKTELTDKDEKNILIEHIENHYKRFTK